MTFVNPAFLFGLLLAAPLVAIYLLKVRPRRRPTTAWFLWQSIVEERRSSALFRRLRDALSLILMVLALVALAFAAARPRFDPADDRDLLMVIDTSTSMQAPAAEGGGSAFDEAIRRARDLVAGLGPGRRAAIATVDGRLVDACGFTDDPRRLRSTLDALSVRAIASTPGALEPLARSAALADRHRVVLLTDGVGTRFAIPDHIEIVAVGRAAAGAAVAGASDAAGAGDATEAGAEAEAEAVTATEAPANIGIAGADLVTLPGGDELLLWVRLVSSHADPVDAEIRLRSGDRTNKIIPVTVEPGVGDPLVLTAAGRPGRYQLEVGPAAGARAFEDAVPADDLAFLVAHAPDPVLVAVAGATGAFYELAVEAFDGAGGLMRLHRAADERAPDVLVVAATDEEGSTDGTVPISASDLSIVFGPGGGERLEAPLPRLLADDHPALRWLPIEQMRFPGARDVTAPEGSAVLVRDLGGADLVWQRRIDGRIELVFNLDPMQGEFVLSPYFPLVVHGAATHLAGRPDTLPSTIAAGSEVTPPGARPGERPRIERIVDAASGGAEDATPVAATAAADSDDDGSRGNDATSRGAVVLASDSDARRLAAVRLDEPGHFRSSTASRRTDLAASAIGADESRLATTVTTTEEVSLPGGRPPWVLLTVLALLILAAEEMLYHRRRVG